jgi:hypothetical protein
MRITEDRLRVTEAVRELLGRTLVAAVRLCQGSISRRSFHPIERISFTPAYTNTLKHLVPYPRLAFKTSRQSQDQFKRTRPTRLISFLEATYHVSIDYICFYKPLPSYRIILSF